MRPCQFVLLFMLASSCNFASGKDTPSQDPIVWGRLSGNAGCVIFAEGHKTKGMFWGVAITTQTTGKLTVIEAQNYPLDKTEYLETQDVMNDLMIRAQKDNVKFVKIPEKYPPELLLKARAMCKPDA